MLEKWNTDAAAWNFTSLIKKNGLNAETYPRTTMLHDYVVHLNPYPVSYIQVLEIKAITKMLISLLISLLPVASPKK